MSVLKRRTSRCLTLAGLLTFLFALPVAAQLTGGGKVFMRLSAVGTSPTRGRNMVVQLVPEYPGTADTLLVRFPAHSFTRKEAELVRLFRASVQRRAHGTPLDQDPTLLHLHAADSLEVVLKVPRRHASLRLDDWRVVRVTTK